MATVSGDGVPKTTNAALIVSPETCTITPDLKESFSLQITNVSFETLLFRLLTTNPQRYLVRPRKGVLKPNTSVSLTVTLNREELKSDSKLIGGRDDFRVDYCVMRPGDVIEPRDANVPEIIKTRKRDSRNEVHFKTFCCKVDAPPASVVAANRDNVKNASLSPVASAISMQTSVSPDSPETLRTTTGGAKMTSRQLEVSTLAEKNKRQIAEQQQATRKRTMGMMVVGILVLFFAVWFGLSS